jgi:hypothetical protein
MLRDNIKHHLFVSVIWPGQWHCCLSCQQTVTWFCSRCLGTHLEHTLLNYSLSWAIACAKPTLSFAAISKIITVFKNHCSSILCVLFVDVDSHWDLSVSTPSHPLSNILICSYALRCGKHFCTYWAANRQRISAPFRPSDHTKHTKACCLSFVETSSGAAIFIPCLLGIDGLLVNHSQLVTVWPWATVQPGLSIVASHTMNISSIAYTV